VQAPALLQPHRVAEITCAGSAGTYTCLCCCHGWIHTCREVTDRDADTGSYRISATDAINGLGAAQSYLASIDAAALPADVANFTQAALAVVAGATQTKLVICPATCINIGSFNGARALPQPRSRSGVAAAAALCGWWLQALGAAAAALSGRPCVCAACSAAAAARQLLLQHQGVLALGGHCPRHLGGEHKAHIGP
jgi:hypothetical protein